MLRFRVRMRPRKLSKVEGLGTGPEGRLQRLRKHVTALIRHERIESTFAQCDEARGYAEKLIQMAVRNGDTHKHTMEMADHWLLEKDLIHKLFRVLVPRYSSLPAAATSLHRISGTFPSDGTARGVLELKGHPWPSVTPQPRDTSLLLHNVLLQEARHHHHHPHPPAPSSPPSGSSVDDTAAPSVSKKASESETKGGLL